MAVAPSISFSQSTDGRTLTIIDTSDYTSGDITDYTREVELWSGKDGTGSILYSLPFTGSDLEVEQAVTLDRYYSAKMIWTGSPAIDPIYINFVTQVFEQNLLNGQLNKNCGCGKTKNCDATTLGFIYLYEAQVATQAGNSGLANSFIQASYKWLNS